MDLKEFLLEIYFPPGVMPSRVAALCIEVFTQEEETKEIYTSPSKRGKIKRN